LLRTLTVAKGNPDIVVLADDFSIDNSVSVAGHESGVARDAREACHVVHGSAVWRSHDQLVRRYLMTAGTARAAQTEQTANANANTNAMNSADRLACARLPVSGDW